MRGLVAAIILTFSAVIVAIRPGWFVEPSPGDLLASDDPAVRWHGATQLANDRAATWPDDHRRDFLDVVAPLAVSSAAEYCLPPSVTIAQAVLESGWGTSRKAREQRNLFGMKARRTHGGVASRTWEVVGGEKIEVLATFRTYENWAESVEDHDERLATDGLYARARAVRHDRDAFVSALAPIYATDPSYARRLGVLIDDYDLDAFDDAALEAARRRGRCAG